MAAIVFFLNHSVEETQAGHGDVDDAASCNASIADRFEPLWMAHSIIRQIRQLGSALVDASSMVVNDDVVAVFKQDFEMRLCDCRALGPDFLETEKSELVETVVLGPLKTSIQPRFRFTRDDLLRPFHFPGGSFVSTLNLEEYRPYDILDSRMISLDTPVVPVLTEVDQLEWVARESERHSDEEDTGLLLIGLGKQLTSDWAQRYLWVSSSGLEIAKFGSSVMSKIYHRVQQHVESQWVIISFNVQRVGVEALSLWFTPGETVDTVSNPPRPVHKDASKTIELRQIFGSCVLADPLNATAGIASIRPPMLVDPMVGPAMKSEQTPLVAENMSWEMVILMQEPSWGLSDQGSGLPAPEAASKNQDAQSASLTENPGYGASQR